MGPNDGKATLVQECRNHGNIYAVEVNFTAPQAAYVLSPVIPKILDDFHGQGMCGVEKILGWVSAECSIG